MTGDLRTIVRIKTEIVQFHVSGANDPRQQCLEANEPLPGVLWKAELQEMLDIFYVRDLRPGVPLFLSQIRDLSSRMIILRSVKTSGVHCGRPTHRLWLM